MAVAMTAGGAAPIVAAALQNCRQLGLEQLLDEPANTTTNRRLQRIKPILAEKWPRCGRCDSLFHGVISWRLAGRLLGVFQSRDYAAFNSYQPSDTTAPVARNFFARKILN